VTLKVDVMLSNSVIGAGERARELEAMGVDGAFTFENSHDLFFPLVAAAPACTLDLFTNVAMAFPRSPMHMANAAYDLQLLSQGRFRLGLGSQIKPHIEKRYGARWGKPVPHMRESVEATKAILQHWQDGTPLRYEGEYTKHTLMTPAFHPGPNPYGIPKILVGALGPKMNEMAAEVADGVLVMPFNSERHMKERTLPAIDRGLATAGRTRADYEITAEVIIGCGRNDQELEAAKGIRNLLSFYGSTPSYKPVLDVEGWGDLQPELNTLSKRGEWGEMANLITDDMIETIGVYGTPRQCAEEIVRRYGADAQRICAYFPFYEANDELIAELTAELKTASST
jgi:probable F420-dependent oxidoreductase